jgi:hypothetical protein
MAGEEDDRQAPLLMPQGILDSQAVLPGEAHVEHEAGGPDRLWAAQKFMG